MRILVAHNAYQHRGGEDAVVESEIELLRAHGHEVRLMSRHNDELDALPRLEAAAGTIWSRETTRRTRAEIDAFAPDVVHVHNIYPLMSPSLYWACSARGVPVVQTLHNFRLHCAQATYLRNDQVCEDCLGKVPWRGVVRGCYRGSRLQSAVLVGSLQAHRVLGTFEHKVDRYIALTEFCRRKLVEGGLPERLITVKPNFVDLPAPPQGPRSGLVYVGRLSHEKGVRTLVDAAVDEPAVDLTVIGSGPEAGVLARAPHIRVAGSVPPDGVRQAMTQAMALVLPSICYETFPRTLVEAYANGLPAIASRLGSLPELVEEGRTGLLFEPGNSRDLAAKMRWARDNPAVMAEMGRTARACYEQQFTGAANYRCLMTIYEDAIESRQR